jgi:hypothetical protein
MPFRDSPLRTSARISEMDDHVTRILPQINGCDSFVVSGLINVPISRPRELRYPECRYPDMCQSFRDFHFCSLCEV